METEIEIHVLKDGTQMITAMVAGRPIAMASFEWQLFCRDMLGAIETHLTSRAPDLLRADPRSAVAHPTSESTADNRRAKSATSG